MDRVNTGQSGCLALLLKSLVGLVIIAAAGYVYVYLYERIDVVRLDDRYDPKYGFDVGMRQEYYNQKFPDDVDIERFLSNSTLLRSRPDSGNEVYYFDNNKKFYSWHGRQIEVGRWLTSPRLQVIRLGDKWRVAVVYTFCMTFSDRPLIAQQDNCYSVTSLRSLLARGRVTFHEVRKGDVFRLAAQGKAPFQLPKSQITIDTLLATKSPEAKD